MWHVTSTDNGFCDYNIITITGDLQYVWPETSAGVEVTTPCQGGTEGVARRLCNASGEWERPDLIECCKDCSNLCTP